MVGIKKKRLKHFISPVFQFWTVFPDSMLRKKKQVLCTLPMHLPNSVTQQTEKNWWSNISHTTQWSYLLSTFTNNFIMQEMRSTAEQGEALGTLQVSSGSCFPNVTWSHWTRVIVRHPIENCQSLNTVENTLVMKHFSLILQIDI